MKDGPIILGDGLEIHYIQKNSGKENEFFEAYELRKDFGHGDIKTLRRGIPSIIKSLASFRQPIAKDTMESLIKIARQFDDDNRNAHEILIADSPWFRWQFWNWEKRKSGTFLMVTGGIAFAASRKCTSIRSETDSLKST